MLWDTSVEEMVRNNLEMVKRASQRMERGAKSTPRRFWLPMAAWRCFQAGEGVVVPAHSSRIDIDSRLVREDKSGRARLDVDLEDVR